MTIKAILFDIDGTLIFKNEVIPQAAAAIATLSQANYKLRFLTNITRQSPEAIAQMLAAHGLPIAAEHIQTATTACVDWLLKQPDKTCFLLVPETVRPLFDVITCTVDRPDYVVIGDIGDRFNYRILDQAFNYLDQGAELIALQRNLFWFDGTRKRLDCGAFITGLEAATEKSALVTGKPSPCFFQSAIAALGTDAAETLVVGDDVLTDIAGAHRCGMPSVLVSTGKFQSHHLEPPFGHHTWFLPSVAQLPALLAEI